jgi:hypothetical protein
LGVMSGVQSGWGGLERGGFGFATAIPLNLMSLSQRGYTVLLRVRISFWDQYNFILIYIGNYALVNKKGECNDTHTWHYQYQCNLRFS